MAERRRQRRLNSTSSSSSSSSDGSTDGQDERVVIVNKGCIAIRMHDGINTNIKPDDVISSNATKDEECVMRTVNESNETQHNRCSSSNQQQEELVEDVPQLLQAGPVKRNDGNATQMDQLANKLTESDLEVVKEQSNGGDAQVMVNDNESIVMNRDELLEQRVQQPLILNNVVHTAVVPDSTNDLLPVNNDMALINEVLADDDKSVDEQLCALKEQKDMRIEQFEDIEQLDIVPNVTEESTKPSKQEYTGDLVESVPCPVVFEGMLIHPTEDVLISCDELDTTNKDTSKSFSTQSDSQDPVESSSNNTLLLTSPQHANIPNTDPLHSHNKQLLLIHQTEELSVEEDEFVDAVSDNQVFEMDTNTDSSTEQQQLSDNTQLKQGLGVTSTRQRNLTFGEEVIEEVMDQSADAMDISYAEEQTPPDLNEAQLHSQSAMDISIGDAPQDPSVENTFKKAEETGVLTHIKGTAYETPVKNTTTPNFDSRTITRPSKKGQILPEAVVSPVINQKTDTPTKMNDDTTVDKQQSVQEPVPSVQQVQPVPQPPAQSEQPPDQISSKTQSANSSTAKSSPPNAGDNKQADNTKREQQRSQRSRQRTITVHNQLLADIATVFTEIKQMDIADPLTEAQRRMQAVMVAKERDWNAKIEKMKEYIAHEQKRSDCWEQKASERHVILGEYDHTIKKLIDELKQHKARDITCERTLGGPGPERTLSPDDAALLVKERDQLAEDVNSLESSYSELFRRYEKLRQTTIDVKNNEDLAKKERDDLSRRNQLMQDKFEMLRRNAEEQLDLANNEIERIHKQHDTDMLSTRLRVKQLDTKIETLNVNLEAKQREIDEMTTLFEEVINKADNGQ